MSLNKIIFQAIVLLLGGTLIFLIIKAFLLKIRKYAKETKEERKIRRNKKEKLTGIGILLDFMSFGAAILFLTLPFLGGLNVKLGTNYNDTFAKNVSINFHKTADIGTNLTMQFYSLGERNPTQFIVIYYLAIALWFFWLISDIFEIRKQGIEEKLEKEQLKKQSMKGGLENGKKL